MRCSQCHDNKADCKREGCQGVCWVLLKLLNEEITAEECARHVCSVPEVHESDVFLGTLSKDLRALSAVYVYNLKRHLPKDVYAALFDPARAVQSVRTLERALSKPAPAQGPEDVRRYAADKVARRAASAGTSSRGRKRTMSARAAASSRSCEDNGEKIL